MLYLRGLPPLGKMITTDKCTATEQPCQTNQFLHKTESKGSSNKLRCTHEPLSKMEHIYTDVSWSLAPIMCSHYY